MTRTLTTERFSAVETTKEFRALLKYMRAIAKAEPESVKEKCELESGLWQYASQKTIKAIVEHIDALEFALAVNREAQPVAWRRDDGPFAGIAITRAKSFADIWIAKGWTVTPLYTAPPAPAVPDGWISCSDRMPEVGERDWRTALPVLVKCEIGVIPAYYGFTYHEGEQCFGFMESVKFGDASGSGPEQHENRLMMHVTHWMPLPVAPEGGN
ncbi:TPA: DUF551 domain-containing protein [Serratia marcescens]